MTSLMELVKAVYAIYMEKMVPRAAAALSYYLTMTIFPLIICLYALFGQNYEVAMNLINYLEQFLTPSASELIRSFLLHLRQGPLRLQALHAAGRCLPCRDR